MIRALLLLWLAGIALRLTILAVREQHHRQAGQDADLRFREMQVVMDHLMNECHSLRRSTQHGRL
jgi:hypothetical protein